MPGAPLKVIRSSREGKTNVEPVDTADALEGVRNLDVATWNYASQDESIRHMGPMAEDFYDEFGLGGDRERIAGVDADGVAFGAIQALADELDARNDRIDEQESRIDELEAENAALRERLSAIEDRLGESDSTATEPR